MKKVINLSVALFIACMFTLTSYAAGKDLLKSNIPQIYGKAKGASEGASDLTIIHVQDAHGNVEAQENIQSIIKTLAEQGKVDGLSYEGAWWEAQMKGFEAIDNEEGASEAVADFWTKYSMITGSERYKILNDRKMPLIGNEDETLHKSNVDALKGAYSSKKESLAAAEKIKGTMEALKLKLFDENTRKFLQSLEDFENDKITLTTYAKALQQEAENAGVKWGTYHNFNKVIESISLEDSIDFAKIDRERLDMVDELETKVDKKVSDEIVTKSLNYRLGRLSAADYYEFLLSKSADAKIDMAKYENVSQYAKLVQLYAAINDDALFAETDRLENAVKGAIFKTDAQINFDKHFMNLEVLTKMISLEMTRADLAFYNENKPSAVKAIAFLKDQAKSLGLGIEINEALGKIDQSVNSNEKFYQIAMKRDEVMVENTLAMMDERGFKTVVLVAGGFHSEGIVKALQARTVSHMIITPRITNPDAPNFHQQYMLGEETEASKIIKDLAATTLDGRNQDGEDPDKVQGTWNVLKAQEVTGEAVTAEAILQGLVQADKSAEFIMGQGSDVTLLSAEAQKNFTAAQEAFGNALGDVVVEFARDGVNTDSIFFGPNKEAPVLRSEKDGKPVIIVNAAQLDLLDEASAKALFAQLAQNEAAEVAAEKSGDKTVADVNKENVALQVLLAALTKVEEAVETSKIAPNDMVAAINGIIADVANPNAIKDAEFLKEIAEDFSKGKYDALSAWGDVMAIRGMQSLASAVGVANVNDIPDTEGTNFVYLSSFDVETNIDEDAFKTDTTKAQKYNNMTGIKALADAKKAPVIVASSQAFENVVQYLKVHDSALTDADIAKVTNQSEVQNAIANNKVPVMVYEDMKTNEIVADLNKTFKGVVTHAVNKYEIQGVDRVKGVYGYDPLAPVMTIQAFAANVHQGTDEGYQAAVSVLEKLFEVEDAAKTKAEIEKMAKEGGDFNFPNPKPLLQSLSALVKATAVLAWQA